MAISIISLWLTLISAYWVEKSNLLNSIDWRWCLTVAKRHKRVLHQTVNKQIRTSWKWHCCSLAIRLKTLPNITIRCLRCLSRSKSAECGCLLRFRLASCISTYIPTPFRLFDILQEFSLWTTAFLTPLLEAGPQGVLYTKFATSVGKYVLSTIRIWKFYSWNVEKKKYCIR